MSEDTFDATLSGLRGTAGDWTNSEAYIKCVGRSTLGRTLTLGVGGAVTGLGAAGGALVGAVIGAAVGIKTCARLSPSVQTRYFDPAGRLSHEEFGELVAGLSEANPHLSQARILEGIARERSGIIARAEARQSRA